MNHDGGDERYEKEHASDESSARGLLQRGIREGRKWFWVERDDDAATAIRRLNQEAIMTAPGAGE